MKFMEMKIIEPKQENDCLNPTNPYSASKAGAEMIINSYIKSYNLPIIILRCNNVYGENQNIEKVIPKFIHQLLNNKKITIEGTGLQKRNFIHVIDVCNIINIIINKNKREIYNIGNDKEFTIIDISKILIENIKKNINYTEYIEYVPDEIL